MNRQRHIIVADLHDSINVRTDHRINQNPRPFVWRKTADEILDNLARRVERISQTGRKKSAE